jgi:hypothetical protein
VTISETRFGDPESGWVHRIDFVPEPGRVIEFRRLEDPPRSGRVVYPRSGDTFWKGIGDDVRLDMGTHLLVPSLTFTHWRYAK